ncbi:MAG: HAD family hydrolase [Candidatus Saccharimonas sp.]
MELYSLSNVNYEAILQYADEHDIKLFVFDLNGVLDDYYIKKVSFLQNVLMREHEHLLPELWLAIERAYMMDHTATIKSSTEQFLNAKGLFMTEAQRDMLAHDMFSSQLTNEAKAFLDSLTIPFVIYTSLSTEQADKALVGSDYNLFTRDDYKEMKPSIANLEAIMTRYGATPQETCVVGDGLVDDLMPASLIGVHTILVSPYAQAFAHSTKV